MEVSPVSAGLHFQHIFPPAIYLGSLGDTLEARTALVEEKLRELVMLVRWISRGIAQLLIAFSALGVTAAHALIIVVEPDNYAEGTNLSHIQEGLTMQFLAWPNGSPYGNPTEPIVSDVYAESCLSSSAVYCPPPTGELGFGYTYLAWDYASCVRGGGTCFGGTRVLEITFDSPTDYVQLAFSWLSDAPIMLAYDDQNQLISSAGCAFCGGGPSEPRYTTLSIRTEGREGGISRIVAGGAVGRSYADQLAYNVPEPSTFGLLGAGLLGLGFMRHKRAS